MEELKARISDLTGEVHELRRAFDGFIDLREQDQERVGQVEVQAARQKTWLLAAVLGVVLLVMAGLAVNRVTLAQAQRAAQADLSAQVTRCFLRPGAAPPPVVAECGRRFGPTYLEVQQRSAEATAGFSSLQEWARSEGWVPPGEE